MMPGVQHFTSFLTYFLLIFFLTHFYALVIIVIEPADLRDSLPKIDKDLLIRSR